MGLGLTTLVTLLKTVTLLLGGAITYFAYEASLRTRSHSIRMLAAGFGIVTVGALLAGIVDTLLHVDPLLALVVESAFTVIGFAVILYSLYAED
ncbi:hypotheical protein [Halarchaeum acidiphilum MH1-52-1]|uniref:Hypotheical protein n=1 Tax=Halarchaeum acidiphilum MH1-52-1 TaxID=1261545 RepID=U2YYM1_9EURY|nr:hypothetical protein [Halarchaeum acidiphilum]GAD53892.1 hypotheical protein [Halarchaeum acidiphilum MH1-52-1]